MRHGALARLHNEWIDVRRERIASPVRTIGAGDTFVGTLVVKLADGAAARESIEAAVDAARAFVGHAPASTEKQTETTPCDSSTDLTEHLTLPKFAGHWSWRVGWLAIGASLIAAAWSV